MRRRLAALVLVASAMLPACASGGGRGIGADERVDALEASAHAPRSFTYEIASGGARTRIEGDVEDDYRYRAAVSADDRQLYEEVTLDDHRFVHLLDPAAVPEPYRQNPQLAALLDGRWVADAAAAPGEFRKLDAPAVVLDPWPILERVRFLERLQADHQRFRQFRFAVRYDPKSVSYSRRRDKFAAHPEAGERYDIVPGGYDLDLLFQDGVPADLQETLEATAMYTAFWFKGGRVTRVERFFDVDADELGRRIRAAVARNAKRAAVAASTLPVPPTPHPFREVLTFAYAKPGPAIAPPVPTAVVAFPPVAPAGATGAA